MNYLKIHNLLIKECASLSIIDRIRKRNSLDYRLSEDYIYTEKHHILPTSLGGGNNSDNIVEVLPEEHIFLHQLRYKIFNTREDMLAVRFCLNGYSNNTSRTFGKKLILNKKLRQGYSWIRQNSASFRKEHGWQTEDGRRRISESMKDMIVVKDGTSWEPRGKHHKDHPKILSGEWVHHSKDVKQVINPKNGKRMMIHPSEAHNYQKWSPKNNGSNNSMYSGLTREDIISAFKDYIKYIDNAIDPKIMSARDFIKWAKEKNSKFPAICSCISIFRFPERNNSLSNGIEFLIEFFTDNPTYYKKLARAKTDTHKEKRKKAYND